MATAPNPHPNGDLNLSCFAFLRDEKEKEVMSTGPMKREKSYTGYQTGKRRGRLHVIFLHIAIKVRYSIESCFFLKPLFGESSGHRSFLRPRGMPEVDYFTKLAIRMLFLLGTFIRNYPTLATFLSKIGLLQLLNHCYIALMKRVARIMKESNVDWDRAREIPVPEFDWKNCSPEDFYNTFVKSPHPVVLRGYLEGSHVMERCGFDALLSRYGDEKVLMTKNGVDGAEGLLREVEDPRNYVHNSEVLFKKYPEIQQDLIDSLAKVEHMLKKKGAWSQMFMGRKSTGTPFHFANTHNMFYMVDGVKQWYMMDPYDAYMQAPLYNWGGSSGFNICGYPDVYPKEMVPAFEYCPYFTTILQPGDALYQPAWWPHAVRNLSDKSVGISNRMLEGGAVGSNFKFTEDDYEIHRQATLFSMIGPGSTKFFQEVLYEPSPQWDEHVSFRERRNRFSSVAKKLTNGDIVINGWKPLF